MKYSSEYINSLSFKDYIKLMADELNANGFKEDGQYEYHTYENDPKMRRFFMMGPVNDPYAMSFLKSEGLLENGRCPSCGAPMFVYRYTWSDRRDPTKKFYVCYGCAKNNGRGDGHSMDGCPSGVPNSSSSGTGCALGLVFLPFYLVKSFIMSII